MEEWKDIPNFEGLYEVSDKGRVRSKEGKTTYTKRHGVRLWKSRMLKEKNPNGRDVRVDLWKDGVPHGRLVHRLVAKAFHPNPENKPTINHKDGNPRNNNKENIEWATYEENSNHAFDNDLMSSNIKVKLKCKKNGSDFEFRSMAKGGEFLERNPGYISLLLSRGKKVATSPDGKEYEIHLIDG